ncbi:MAG: hypothetical protein ACR2NR_18950 [Solirubrobacteraceae bacterium]
MPGVDPVRFPVDSTQTLAAVAQTLATYPHTAAEPPLACCVTGTCPASVRARRRLGRGSPTRVGSPPLSRASTASTMSPVRECA